MNVTTASSRIARAVLPWTIAALAAGAGQQALAQGAPPANAAGTATGGTSSLLPGASAGTSPLPAPPANLQLPGIDPRQCGTSKHAALCAEGRWARFAHMNVAVRVGAFDGTYTIEHTGSGETHATSLERMEGKTQAGEAVIVSEDAFAFRSRRPSASPDDMLDQIMTSPIVFSELAAILLEATLPEGPGGIGRTQTIKGGNDTQFVLTQAPGGAVLYGPPWSVAGTARRGDANAVVFELEFRYRPVDEAGRVARSGTETARLTGTARYAPLRDRLPDTFDLVGWKVVRAGSVLGDAKTLAEARQMAGVR
jgi:hypothetical protein